MNVCASMATCVSLLFLWLFFSPVCFWIFIVCFLERGGEREWILVGREGESLGKVWGEETDQNILYKICF